ncbi:MAG: hypothetical protein ACM3X4_11095 [Ignavibacteriales bacterium]
MREETPRRRETSARGVRVAGIAVRAILLTGMGSMCLAVLQLGDFTPLPAAWSLCIPVLGGVAIGLARMSIHEVMGCVAVVLALSPALAPFLVAIAASELERTEVMRAALRNSVAADWLLLLPCVLAGIVIGRWIASLYPSRPERVRERG